MSFDSSQRYHYPEVPDPKSKMGKDMPADEPYIRFRCATSTQTYEKNPESGELEPVVSHNPNDYYYFPIGPARYDTVSETGHRVIEQLIRRRELRGHRIDCFGNFPQSKYWVTLAKMLKNSTGLAIKNPEHPIRQAVEAELRAEMEQMRSALVGTAGKSISELEQEISVLRSKLGVENHANKDKQKQAEGRASRRVSASETGQGRLSGELHDLGAGAFGATDGDPAEVKGFDAENSSGERASAT